MGLYLVLPVLAGVFPLPYGLGDCIPGNTTFFFSNRYIYCVMHPLPFFFSSRLSHSLTCTHSYKCTCTHSHTRTKTAGQFNGILYDQVAGRQVGWLVWFFYGDRLRVSPSASISPYLTSRGKAMERLHYMGREGDRERRRLNRTNSLLAE